MGKKSQPKGAESQGGKGGKGAGKGAKGAKSDAQSDAATGNPAKLKGCQIITARHILVGGIPFAPNLRRGRGKGGGWWCLGVIWQSEPEADIEAYSVRNKRSSTKRRRSWRR